jgi:predicted TIM-barrel fold metal-dependent hydrolase
MLISLVTRHRQANGCNLSRQARILDEMGDDNLIIGTDYGHRDTATEVEALKRMPQDASLQQSTVRKILETNPGRLHAI